MKYMMLIALDSLFGDPKWLLHPVQMIGYGVDIIEKFLRDAFKGKYLKIKGVVLVVVIGFLSYMIPLFLLKIESIGRYLWFYFAWTGIGMKSLYEHGANVCGALKKDESEARKALGLIVSRETDGLDKQSIIKGTIETVAENTSDGIIGPLFYLSLGGIPLMMLYKAINTMDAMVGYKNERYMEFGYFAAKMDDVMNLIPARLTAVLLALSSALLGFDYKGAIKVTIRDAKKNESPNAGYPEAAVAGALDIRIGGPSVYHGKIKEKSYIGNKGREIEENDIKKTLNMMIVSVLLMVAILSLMEVLI